MENWFNTTKIVRFHFQKSQYTYMYRGIKERFEEGNVQPCLKVFAMVQDISNIINFLDPTFCRGPSEYSACLKVEH